MDPPPSPRVVGTMSSSSGSEQERENKENLAPHGDYEEQEEEDGRRRRQQQQQHRRHSPDSQKRWDRDYREPHSDSGDRRTIHRHSSRSRGRSRSRSPPPPPRRGQYHHQHYHYHDRRNHHDRDDDYDDDHHHRRYEKNDSASRRPSGLYDNRRRSSSQNHSDHYHRRGPAPGRGRDHDSSFHSLASFDHDGRSTNPTTSSSTKQLVSLDSNNNNNNNNLPRDERLGTIQDDPRGEDPTKRITKKASSRGNGRNTESFDPASTLVRPDLRIHVGSNAVQRYNKRLKHDDVVIVPELFGPEDDWTMYYQLVQEIRDLQATGTVQGSEWISWHEGAHLICKNPTSSPTVQAITNRLCDYFHIRKDTIGTRFNWYKDSSDWKPFHHDSAAFNPHRATKQNITVGVSFGATRELAFIRAADPPQNNNHNHDKKVRLYFPQCNNGVFSFGRDANILWKHGINALPLEEQDGKGRISIILWGLAQDVMEEDGSPPLLGSNGQGPHANRNREHHAQQHHHHHPRGRRDGRNKSN